MFNVSVLSCSYFKRTFKEVENSVVTGRSESAIDGVARTSK